MVSEAHFYGPFSYYRFFWITQISRMVSNPCNPVIPDIIRDFYRFAEISTMPSFDIVSKVDGQTLDNAVNVTTKEITNRFDFKNSHVVIDLNKKEYKINIEADDDMKLRQIIDVLISRSNKQGIAPEAFDLSKDYHQSGKYVKKEVSVRNGLKQEDAKKVVKLIKDSGLKVQASIMDDMVRVTGKKIDDLQEVIKLCKDASLGIPMQYENMRS